ncbi:MAG: GNAT family N-acetyltransferase [Cyanobacteria bacterium J06626_18]
MSSTTTLTTFRPATQKDCPTIARLIQIASDGVCDYIWNTLTDDYPGLLPIEIGAQRYAEADGNFSYCNCTLAIAGGVIQGLMMAFPIPPADSTAPPEPPAANGAIAPDVLAPYALEQPNSWYICALAMFAEFRCQGIGTQFLDLATHQAKMQNLPELSLLCFEQNVGAARLYERYGFQTVNRAPVVPHPLIHYTGNILLMTKSVSIAFNC